MYRVGWTHPRNTHARLRSLALALTLTVGLAAPIVWAENLEAQHQDAEQHTPAGSHREGHSQHGHHGDATKERFDDIDKAVEMFENTERDAWQKPDEVLAHMQLQPGDVVADIGAGTGYFTRRFAETVGADGMALGLDVLQGGGFLSPTHAADALRPFHLLVEPLGEEVLEGGGGLEAQNPPDPS